MQWELKDRTILYQNAYYIYKMLYRKTNRGITHITDEPYIDNDGMEAYAGIERFERITYRRHKLKKEAQRILGKIFYLLLSLAVTEGV